MDFFKSLLKALFLFVLISIIVVALSIISAIRNPIGGHTRKLDKDKPLFEKYEQKRTTSEVAQMKQDLDTLSNTGSCVTCDFNVRSDEKDKEDLYEAIENAKKKGVIVDLSGSDLFFAQLDGVDLSGANLSGTNLIGAHLKDANLSGARLRGAILSGAKLRGADLQGADLTRAEIGRTELIEADLTGAHLHEAIVVGTNLSGANLTDADLSNAVIIDCLTYNAKCIGTDFRGARIHNAFAKNADFTNAIFDNVFIRSFNTLTLWLLLAWEAIKNTVEKE